jgi:hypothetical protein
MKKKEEFGFKRIYWFIFFNQFKNGKRFRQIIYSILSTLATKNTSNIK